MIQEINEKSAKLNGAIKLMGKYGRELAEAETEYYKAKAEMALQLSADGMPVSLISIVIKGKVAKELLKYETALTQYETSKEYINTLKTQIRVLEQQISMEWSNAGKE